MARSVNTSEVLDQTLYQLKEPTKFRELPFAELIKPLNTRLLKGLDQAVDEHGSELIRTLVDNVNLRGEGGTDMIKPFTKWGKRCGVIGAAGLGGSYLTDEGLAKAIFVAGLILCGGSAAQFLYSGLILYVTDQCQKADQIKAGLTAQVQQQMRLQIAARLEHCSTDKIVDQGAKKFDQHDGMLTEHRGDIEELKALNQVKDQRLNNQDQLIAKQSDELDLLKRADQAKDRELREQKSMLIKQEAILAEQRSELSEQKSKFIKQENKLIDQESKISEQENKLATQAEMFQALLQRFNALENSPLAQAG